MLSQKNILIVSSKSADYGGVEKHCLDLIKGFSKVNRVYIMCPQGALVNEYKNAGAKVILKTPKSANDLGFSLFVKNFCKENRIHIVHAHELISSLGLFGSFLAGVKKRVYHVHTPFLLWKHKNIITKVLKSIPNYLINFLSGNFFATDVIALTPGIKRHKKFIELILFTKITVVPNSIDFSEFININKQKVKQIKEKYSINKNLKVIGNLSRTSSEKNQIILLKAFNKINKLYPNKYFLLIAGGGELQNNLNLYAKKHFSGQYCITGKFDQNEKVLLYKSIDYFVFPSLAEGFGYVLVEAVASKLPVLCSDLPVLKNVISKGVYFFNPKDVNSLVNQLKKVLKLPKNKLSTNIQLSYKEAQKYSFESFVINYSTIYSSNKV